MTDSLGNRKESAWSAWKEIRAPLAVTTLVPSLPSPRAVLGGEISWSAETTGGIGGVTYQFRSVRNGVESIEQEGPSLGSGLDPPEGWHLQNKIQGLGRGRPFRQKGLVRRVPVWSRPSKPRAWSPSFPLRTSPTPRRPSATSGRSTAISCGQNWNCCRRTSWKSSCAGAHIRDTGGISSANAQALRAETGVEAVLITSLETWHEAAPPRVSLLSRLVTTERIRRSSGWTASAWRGGIRPGSSNLGVSIWHRSFSRRPWPNCVLHCAPTLPGALRVFATLPDGQGVRLAQW